MARSFKEICDSLRSYWRNRGSAGSTCVLIRPGPHGFIETSADEIDEIVNIIERQPMVDIPFNALERLGFRLLMEGMGLDPWTGEVKR